MKFSERYGYTSVRELVQLESIDEPLRNALWSILQVSVWDQVRASTGVYGGYYLSSVGNEKIKALCERLWFSYFKKPLDTLDHDWNKVLAFLRRYYFDCEWFEVYDFLEFIANNYERYNFKDQFLDVCNNAFEKELSAYRFVGSVISRVTEKEEVEEIEQALVEAAGPVRTHMQRSLELLSNRETPDYRNSIKEAISAVECLAAKATQNDKGTLGQLIKELEGKIGLHPALKIAFSSLYGYTSDEGGIRHALMDAESVKFEDAKFFLVVCSAFVNYINAKLPADS